ncbi:hypothetical protein N657DRAFT_651330 [Parathielavia appendiculata]|uniref:Uncharacterized protein n=1 Tax=Parathielavia appendiculata TaxID=2587402 RepID=A0AAN6TQL6_9PEZI|nr:hypothetical protein N657DRAFT_651330 [Parathielavia appendiculata]
MHIARAVFPEPPVCKASYRSLACTAVGLESRLAPGEMVAAHTHSLTYIRRLKRPQLCEKALFSFRVQIVLPK